MRISKIIKRITKLFYRMFHFGLYVTLLDYCFEITKSRRISEIKHRSITNWLKKRYKYFILEHFDQANKFIHGEIPKQIWICWWDGIGMMPPLVKACYNSVLRYSNDFKVTVITKNNYAEYIFIPDHVMKKVNNKKMTITHFSNIIRMALLYKHGGLWLDATFLVTDTIKLENNSFFTIRREYNGTNISKGRWTGNCIAGAPNFYFFGFIQEFLCEYWKKYDHLITYHLYDYSINLAFESFPVLQEIFGNISPFNKNDIIVNNLKNEFDPLLFKKAIENTILHKLSWKRTGPTRIFDNKLTFYGYILENYL